ncbi:MAG: hypothetical protein NVSMB17_00020 [Candidatus Dormibacteria bacterium]
MEGLMSRFAFAEVAVESGYIVAARDRAGNSWKADVRRPKTLSSRLFTHLLVLVIATAPLTAVVASASPTRPPAGARITVPASRTAARSQSLAMDGPDLGVAPATVPTEVPPVLRPAPPSPAPIIPSPELHCPVASPLLVQGFGPSYLPFEPSFAGFRHFHKGLDFSGSFGTPVLAAIDGTVVTAGYTAGGFGLMVETADAFGRRQIYAHLQSASVTRGAHVSTGDTLGLIGSTGLSTGPHLHFELQVGGVALDPSPVCQG